MHEKNTTGFSRFFCSTEFRAGFLALVLVFSYFRLLVAMFQVDARAQERSRFEAIVFFGAAESPRTLGAHLRFTLLGPPL